MSTLSYSLLFTANAWAGQIFRRYEGIFQEQQRADPSSLYGGFALLAFLFFLAM
jgi:hypothetical protein